MDPNDEERLLEPSSSSAPKRKRIRGPYKTYLMDPHKPVPESTLRSRTQASGDGTHRICLQLAHLQEATEGLPAQEVTYNIDVNSTNAGAAEAAADDSTGRESLEDNDGLLALTPDCHDNVGNDQNMLQAATDQDEQADDCDHQDNPSKHKKSLEEKHGLHKRLHKDFTCTKLEALLMILHMAYRHCNTQHFIEDQIKFVNGLFGSNVIRCVVLLDVSYYLYQTLFQPSSSPVRHYFCPSCEVSVDSEKNISTKTIFVKCPKCKKDIDVNSFDSGNYFVNISLKKQIESILNMPGTKLIELDVRDPDKIGDMCDGELYKMCLQPGGPFAGKQFFTVTLNTDGVSVFKSTKNSMWPILMYVNEICPEQRFKVENLILGGLWFGESAPNMALFMKPVLEDLKNLSVEGVKYTKADGSIVKCPVYVTSISLDAVAKAKCLCMKQFNGKMGILYCMHPNDTIAGNGDRPNNSRLHRHYDTSVTYPVRTEMEVIRDMYKADTLQRNNQMGSNSVNGFLGLSVLLTIVVQYSELFPGFTVFSIVWSVIIDYLHLEGLMGDLLELFESILTPEQREILNERVLAIAPPQGMTRKPRSLKDRVHWKAKEYRALLLFYCLPCLEDLLPPPMFSILKLFSRSCYILLSDGISSRDLEEARAGLEKFVVDYQKVFGLKKVTYNLHVTTHIADLVQRMGPLWSYSNFIFESGNGHLVKLIRGTRSVVHEIAVKFTTLQSVNTVIAKNPVSESALKFCTEIMTIKYSQRSQHFEDVFVTGSHSFVSVDNAECELLQRNNVAVASGKVKYFHKAIKKGVVFTSRLYSEGKVYDDSCVMLVDGTFAVVDKIVISLTGELICVMKPIRIAPNDLVPNIKRCCFDVFDNVRLVPFSAISRKCVYLSISNKSFVCQIPNFYERD